MCWKNSAANMPPRVHLTYCRCSLDRSHYVDPGAQKHARHFRFLSPINIVRQFTFSCHNASLASFSSHQSQTSFRSPWQNGMAERWVGSCRRDLLDRIVALNERHLKRLLCEYVRYHHEDRTHLGLEGHLTAGFVPLLRVGSFQRSDSAGCTIVTIERPSPDRLSAGP